MKLYVKNRMIMAFVWAIGFILGILLSMTLACYALGADAVETPIKTPMETVKAIQVKLQKHFTYIDQPAATDVPVIHSGEESFKGDCDDYMLAAIVQLRKHGFHPYAVFNKIKKTGKRHTVAMVYINKKRYYLDNRSKKVITHTQYVKKYNTIAISDSYGF